MTVASLRIRVEGDENARRDSYSYRSIAIRRRGGDLKNLIELGWHLVAEFAEEVQLADEAVGVVQGAWISFDNWRIWTVLDSPQRRGQASDAPQLNWNLSCIHPMKLFVYGTLKKGGCYHDRMHGTFLGEAVAQGWTMVDLGPYPAVVAGSGCVFGELYEVESLDPLDPIEDYPRHYNRKIVPVFVGDVEHAAWIYYLERSDAPAIESGRWHVR